MIIQLYCYYRTTYSPTSQYRNAQTSFLTKSFAQEYNKEIFWNFAESGHGKGPMVGVGSAIKTTIDECSAFHPGVIIACAAAVLIATYDTQMSKNLPKQFRKV